MSLDKLREKMKSVTKTVERALPDIIVDEKVREERLAICTSCEKFRLKTRTCKVCGCFMDVKTWMPRQKCPMDKWGIVDMSSSEK